MTELATLGSDGLRDAMISYRDVLKAHQEALNRLNVYPVPDGDTGTNMALTLQAVVKELDGLGAGASMAEVCKAIAHGSLMGARGNSGVILSQLLRGMTDELAEGDAVDASQLASALTTASHLARQAVVRPVEGTILTVADAAADGAHTAAKQLVGTEEAPLVGVIEAAHVAAGQALERTPELLPALKAAGVVDAGGAGFLLLFDALLSALDQRPLPAAAQRSSSVESDTVAQEVLVGSSSLGPRYEVMYLLDAPDDTVSAFKEVWAGLGDSIVVVGGSGLWNCHIHTDEIGAAIEAALDAGRPREIRVTDLAEQVVEERWVREGSKAVSEAAAPSDTGEAETSVVCVVSGQGIGRIFRSLGAAHQVIGGQTMNPSTAQILDAVKEAPADQVVILPNNRNIRAVAEQVNGVTDKRVEVVATESIVEGFAALLAYDPGSSLEENVAAMTASAEHVLPGEVTQAVRAAEPPCGSVREGDWIGVSRGRVRAVADSSVQAACRLLEELCYESHELLTLIEGEGATAGDTRRITEWLHEAKPAIAVEVHHGGQMLYPYLFGLE